MNSTSEILTKKLSMLAGFEDGKNPGLMHRNKHRVWTAEIDSHLSVWTSITLEVRRVSTSLIGRRYTDEQGALEEIAKCDLICSNCHRIRTRLRNEQRKGKCV